MTRRGSTISLVAACCTALAAAGSVAAAHPAPAAKAPPTPRTSFGRPSLEGMWTANFILRFEATPQIPKLTLPEPEAKALAATIAKAAAEGFDKALDPEVPALMQSIDGLPIVRGERRTRMVISPADGRLPYAPAARKEVEDGPKDDPYDNPEDRDNAERCLVSIAQPPITTFVYLNQLQIVQTRDHVAIHTEYGDDLRIVPFAAAHRPLMFASRLGDSIARWEGETLVIETVGLPERDRLHLFPSLLVPSSATVIERLTRVSDRELLYQFTVVDPATYTAPWLAEFSWFATDKPIFEHACHEGNYSLPGILAGARRGETLAKAAASATGR